MPSDEIAGRRARAAAAFRDLKIDALLVGVGPNLRYLTGFTGSNGLLLLSGDDALLFTDPRYALQAPREAACRVRVVKGALLPHAAGAIKRKRLRNIGFEQHRTAFESWKSLAAALPMKSELKPVAGVIEKLRLVKSESEIGRIRRSVATASAAFEQAVARARAGMRETDLAAELEYRMRKLGAEKPSFETIVAAGDRSALPHAQPTNARLDRGLVVVDMGSVQDGYCSDMTRMLHCGAAGAKARRLYRAVLEAQLAALDAVRAGVSTVGVDRAARQVLGKFGFDKLFTHSTGHGLGLEIHEAPRIASKDGVRLESGMAITIEPGAYIEGFGGVRIEDTVIVRDRGCEVLTPTGKELREI